MAATAAKSGRDPGRPDYQAAVVRLAGLAEQDVAAGAPGVIVRVSDGSRPAVEFAREAPWAKADHELAPDDEFAMASNTKTMVATVILTLVAEHRLSLSDSVEEWLPGLIPDGRAITLRMLLNHTSGLFDFINDPEALASFTGQDTRQWTPRQLIALGVRHDPVFEPGTAYSYSNTNYIALGLVAEQAAHRSLAELIRELVTEPLHLRHTYLPAGSRPEPGPAAAPGYEPDAAHLPPVLPPGVEFAGPARPGGNVEIRQVNSSLAWAAGGMVSTADDWARFSTALMSGELLPPALLREMQTTVAEEPGNPNRYGLGLEEMVTPCGTVWGQDANVPGHSSVELTDTTGRRTASVFTTMAIGLAGPSLGAAKQALVDAAACAMFDKPLPTATPTS